VIWGNSPEVVQGNLDPRLVVKSMEMPLEFVQLSLKAKDRNIGCRIIKTQLLHTSTEIQSLAWLCNLLLGVLCFIIADCNSEILSKCLALGSHILLIFLFTVGLPNYY